MYTAPAAHPDIRVPFREITLTEAAGEPPLLVQDTSGPFTDPGVSIDLTAGLPLARMATISYGESAPLADNNTREGRSTNRRVQLIVMR